MILCLHWHRLTYTNVYRESEKYPEGVFSKICSWLLVLLWNLCIKCFITLFSFKFVGFRTNLQKRKERRGIAHQQDAAVVLVLWKHDVVSSLDLFIVVFPVCSPVAISVAICDWPSNVLRIRLRKLGIKNLHWKKLIVSVWLPWKSQLTSTEHSLLPVHCSTQFTLENQRRQA
jgi:hypothetical protein